MLELAVSTEEEFSKGSEQSETTMHNETIKIPSDKDKIGALIKPASGDRFTRGGVDPLHSTALSSLDFHKSIQDSHRAEEYAPAEQEEAIKRRTKRRESIERARREKYAELHASGKDELDELYGVSMSEQDSDVEYTGTTTGNPTNSQENHLTTNPPLSNKSSPLSSPESSINSDLPHLDDSSIREKFSQSQAAPLYALSQNVNPKEITSSSRGITTGRSRGVHQNLERNQDGNHNKGRKKHHENKIARMLQERKRHKKDVSQLIEDFFELNSS
ncbi:hypothetical protein MMC31_005279, partial [Peltigera leucophlebia]|nr:hypothetical protein [Peltigera leucophlebia]